MSFFSSTSALAQELGSVVELAQKYYLEKDYERASVEIQRLLYFGNRDSSTLALAANIFDALGKNADADYFRNMSRCQQYDIKPDSVENKKSPRLACWLSAAVPGAGQYYSGNFYQGISSQLVMGSATAVSLLLFNHYKPFTAIFSTVPLVCRYYAGGIINAGKCASGQLGH